MKLYIKQRVFTIQDQFEVYDQHNRPIYQVKSPWIRLGKVFKIYDKNKKEVGQIKKRIFSLFPKYKIKLGAEEYLLKRKFSLFRHKYILKGKDWTLKGDFLNHSYDIFQGKKTIMSLRKKWLSWGDSYELNIRQAENTLLALAIVIAIDAELASDKQLIQEQNKKTSP